MLERILVIAHGLLVASLLYRLARRRGAAFDDRFRLADAVLLRRLALWAVVPLAVVAREVVRAGVLLGAGGRPEGFEYLVFHAWVGGADALPLGAAAVAHLVPNLVVLAVAGGLVLRVATRPGNAAANHFRLEIARGLAWLTLFLYPLLSLLVRAWDFYALRGRLEGAVPHLGDAFLVAWGGLGVLVWRGARRELRRRWLLLATPLRDALRRAERRVARAPDDPEALRTLGRVLLAGEAPTRAIVPLRRAVDLDPEEPEGHFLAGATLLRLGEADGASASLRAAGRLLEAQPAPDRSLAYEVTLGLAAARLALGDAEGAVLTAEAARAHRPDELRGTLVEADALVAAGRTGDAIERLARAAEAEDGPTARALRKRVDRLRKRGG